MEINKLMEGGEMKEYLKDEDFLAKDENKMDLELKSGHSSYTNPNLIPQYNDEHSNFPFQNGDSLVKGEAKEESIIDHSDLPVEVKLEAEEVEAKIEKERRKYNVKSKRPCFLDSLNLSPEEIALTDQRICPQCHKNFATKKGLMNHIRDVHLQMRQLFCDQCDYRTARSVELRRHIQVKHEGMRFICEVCGVETTTQSHLNFHVKQRHTPELIVNVPCDICGKVFKFAKNLTGHMRKVHSKRSFCQHCGYQSKSHEDLKLHLANLHDELKNKFQCPKCNKILSAKNAFKYHMRFQHAEEPLEKFPCHFCDYESVSKANLQRHVESIHTKITPSEDSEHPQFGVSN